MTIGGLWQTLPAMSGPQRAFRSAAFWRWTAVLLAAVLALPLVALLVSAATGLAGGSPGLSSEILMRFTRNTAILAGLVGSGVLVVGTGTAWLVTMCRFPGRRVLEWALILPLALPAYVAAYAYSDFLQHPGAVQTLLREFTGWGPKDYWFPNVRSLGGAALMLILVLYPYVYLLARAAFGQQSATAFEASRSLGHSPWRSFLKIALPMARPALAAGTALALMETLADFGTVAYFGVETFTTAIYRTWFSLGDRTGAVQLAMILVGAVFLVLAIERIERGNARYGDPRTARVFDDFALTGWRGAAAAAACALPVVLGFVVPVLVLLGLAIGYGGSPFDPRNLTLAGNSLTLGALGAGFAVAIALLLAFAHRIAPGRLTGAVIRLAALGYAIPGAVIAVGLLIPLTAFENGVDAWMRASLGVSTGLFLTGTIAALVFAYVVRFLAAALGPVEAALVKVSPSIDDAARTLGSGAGGTLCKIHLPMIRGGLLTAALIVFVDIMKELPATLILRPFNFDTLAVQAHRYAADERLAEAAVPSLLIVAAGLIPILVLSWQIARARIGRRRTLTAQSARTGGGLAAVETTAPAPAPPPARWGANRLILADAPVHAEVAHRRGDKQLAA